MRRFIVAYLLFLAGISFSASWLIFNKDIMLSSPLLETVMYCLFFGVCGGIIHCLRGYYLHSAVHKDWDDRWNAWYYIRPLVGGMLGIVSFVFIKAGLLVFSLNTAAGSQEGNSLAYCAVAFLAGYNAQNFLAKLEEISEASLGVHKNKSQGRV